MRTSFNLSHIHGRNVLMFVHVTHSVWRASIFEDTLYTYVPWNHLLTHFTFCIIWCNTTPYPLIFPIISTLFLMSDKDRLWKSVFTILTITLWDSWAWKNMAYSNIIFSIMVFGHDLYIYIYIYIFIRT